MSSRTPTSRQKYSDDLKTFERLKASLPWDSPLLERLNICGEEAGTFPHYVKSCNQPPCPRCRGRYRRKQAKRLSERFAGTPPEGLALMTIVLEPCIEVGDVFTTFDAARQAIRNLHKRRCWPEIQIGGWLETDALADEDMPLLGSDRQRLLADLRHKPPEGGAPLWWPSIHGIVALGSMAHQEFRFDLSSLWSAPRQVDVRPFYVETPVQVSITNIVDYCLKHNCSRSLLGIDSPWPPQWTAQYYSSLYDAKKGFRGSSFSMGLMNRRKDTSSYSKETYICNPESNEDHYDYMPVVI